jgi:hypothetical protein
MHAQPFTVAPANRKERHYGIVWCPRCAGVVVIETNRDGAFPHWVVSVTPERDSRTDVQGLPDDVSAYYSSAIRVLQAGEPDAAAVQLRKTLEAATAHVGLRRQTLMQSIQALQQEGLVTKQFVAVFHHVRAVGNVGAHAGDARVDLETAERALRFTTQILRNLFEVPAELDAIDRSAAAETATVTAAAHDATILATGGTDATA